MTAWQSPLAPLVPAQPPQLQRWRREQDRSRRKAKEDAANALARHREALEQARRQRGGEVWRRLNARTAQAAARQQAAVEQRQSKAARHGQHVERVRRKAAAHGAPMSHAPPAK